MEEKNSDINLHSETIDKAIDIVTESTVQTRNALDVNGAKGVNKFFQFLAATPPAIAMETYIAERPYKLEAAKQKMLKKYEMILPQNRVEPNASICLNVAREFDYYLDEEHIRNMFINILISDMDNSKKSKVHNSYTNIVKDLSKEDAETLKLLKQLKQTEFFIIRPKYIMQKGFRFISQDIYLIYSNKTQIIQPIIINNLSRLNLIDVDFKHFSTKESIYTKAFNNIRETIPPINEPDFKELGYDKGILGITALGQAFIDICLS